MNKDSKLLKEIVFNYHPMFKHSTTLQEAAIIDPSIFNVERLIEQSLAAEGGYNFVDEFGYDFDDECLSDSKTVTVVNNGGRNQSKVIIIGNVHTKIGSLRVTIYNPYSNKIDYMYIPQRAVRILKENNGSQSREAGPKERIRATWNERYDHYNRLEEFRVPNFVALANATS